MAHTPGPWTIEYETEGGEPYDDGVRIDSLEGPVAFNVIDCSAHLIAAAPDLLDALKRCVQWLSDLDNDICEKAELLNAMDAIAKAEGVTMEDKHGPQN
jgi:hypothetical protein